MAEDEAAAVGGVDEAASEEVVVAGTGEPKKEDEGERKLFGVPVMSFVKGGTTTSRHDNYIAAWEADAKARRSDDDQMREDADQHGIHRGRLGDIATLHSNQFTDHPEVMRAYVPLEYMGRRGRDVEYLGVGDIVMAQDPAFDDELTLIIFCPKCKDRGLPAGHCIIHLRQSNRSWHLDTRKAGELFVWEGQPLRSAGTVVDGEPFTCARCAWRARIDNNRVWTL